MRARLIVGTVVALLLAGALPASAQMMGAGGGAGGDMMGSGMHGAAPATGCSGMTGGPAAFGYDGPWISFALTHATVLDLTPDQVNSLTTLRDEFRKEAIRLGSEIRAAEAEVRRLYAQQPLDLQALESRVRAAAGIEADLELARVKTLVKGKALLTPEQQQKAGALARSMGWARGASMMGGPGR